MIAIAVVMSMAGGALETGAAASTKGPARRSAAKRPAIARPAKPVLTATAYAAQVSAIESCADFEKMVWLMEEATPLLRRLFVNGPASKSEFETSDAYAQRLVTALDAKVGDMSRIYTIAPVDDGYASYDADRGVMSIKYGDYHSERVPLTAELDSWGDTTKSYTASNSFGVKRLVKSFSGYELRGQFQFRKGELPTLLQVPMSAAEAFRFKNNNGWLHVLSTLDGYSSDLQHLEPTITDPVEVVTYYRDVTLIPRCAVFTSGSSTVEGWRLDHWKTD